MTLWLLYISEQTLASSNIVVHIKGFIHDSNFYNLESNKFCLRMYIVSGAKLCLLFFWFLTTYLLHWPASLPVIQKWKYTFLCSICYISSKLDLRSTFFNSIPFTDAWAIMDNLSSKTKNYHLCIMRYKIV